MYMFDIFCDVIQLGELSVFITADIPGIELISGRPDHGAELRVHSVRMAKAKLEEVRP